VRYAVSVPNVGAFADGNLLVDFASTAEEAGWDGFFLWDRLLHQAGWDVIDPWVAMGAIARVTVSVRIGIMVVPLARQHPGEVAKRTATLDRMTGGRMTLGVGLGSLGLEFEAFGQTSDPAARGARLDEALDIVAGLMSGEPISHVGPNYTVRSPAMLPVSLQEPRVPIWIAGRWPHRAPFRRAAAWDGVIPSHVGFQRGSTMPPSDLGDIVDFVRRARADGRPFDVAIGGMTPGSDVHAYESVGATWWVETLGWWRGSPKQNMTRLAQGPPG
jgi:alkanesulfonate monooxygenase SsuD/methylene tetrahydromethanopterin reductase-like flavin-dependent oxidoreductase (luciferase family)